MQQIRLKITHPVGLHARPASRFVRAAGRFKSSVRVRNATEGSDWVDAKSILRVLTLGVEQNHNIELQIEGADEAQAAEALAALVESDFEVDPAS
jgi:phosphotransferase system HPr (HPr) family protein